MTPEAKEAIRVAEKWFPGDLVKQKKLAMDILGVIEVSMKHFGAEIVERIRASGPVKH
jgi:hypothetical protein